MSAANPPERVLGITRSKTIDPYSSSISKQQSSMRLTRNASNGDFFKNKELESSGNVGGAPLLRTASLGPSDIANQFKRSLSLNEGPTAPRPQIATQTSQQNMNTFEMHPRYDASMHYGYNQSPFLGPTSFGFEQQQNQNAQLMMNSLMTPIGSYAMQPPMYIDSSPTAHAPLFSPYPGLFGGSIPPSPMVGGTYGITMFSPFAPSPISPHAFHPGLNGFELPGNHDIHSGHAPANRTLTASGLNRNSTGSLMDGSGPVNQFQSGYNQAFPEKNPGERMLEELKLKLKAQPTAGQQQQRFSSGLNQASFGFQPQRPAQQTSFTNMSSKMYEDMGIHWSLSEIKGHILDFARDQYGSRFIQHKLQDPGVSQADKDDLFAELQPYITILCKDVFGNYVIQKLLEVGVGTKEQHNDIYQTAIRNNMFSLSSHMYGCRVIQKLIEQIFGHTSRELEQKSSNSLNVNLDDVYDLSAQNALLDEIRMHVRQLVMDQNGNHVIQKCIEQIRPIGRLDFFFDNFRTQYVLMAKHPYGCRVVQRVLENANLAVIETVISELVIDLESMITDQYANYVVQHIVEHKGHYEALLHDNANQAQGSLALIEKDMLNTISQARMVLYNTVAGNILMFSRHKFGSNVVECCLKHGNPTEREILIVKILSGETLISMMKDPYANYVVQKVIDKASKAQLERVYVVVHQNDSTLRRLTYGKHIINKLKSHNFA